MLRRRLLQMLGLGVAAFATRPFGVMRASAAGARTTPRFFLQIIPQGGLDAIFTTDPKRPGDVDRDIDVPFKPKEIVETKTSALGPPFKALGRWTPRLAIVNAFLQNSANHTSGLAHALRCKTATSDHTPTLLEVLGSRRPHDIATSAFNIGASLSSAFSPQFFGQPAVTPYGKNPGLFDHLDGVDPDDLKTAAAALRDDAAAFGPRSSAVERQTRDNLIATADFFDGVAKAPKFAAPPWKLELESYYHNGAHIQRLLWMFEHKLTRCGSVCVGNLDFDTHVWNTTLQLPLAEYLAQLLDSLFTELDTRIVDGKPLAEQTVVIVGSEMGRFPRLNSAQGKDHFPQAPYLFFGPGITPGTFGATGRDMAALPVALASGKPDRAGSVLRLDDIGATMLALDGANPELYGYTGNRLPFLVS